MPDRSYLLRGLNDSAVRGYYNLMVESAVILGADRTRAESEMLQGSTQKIPLPANLSILITAFFSLDSTALSFETILANVSARYLFFTRQC